MANISANASADSRTQSPQTSYRSLMTLSGQLKVSSLFAGKPLPCDQHWQLRVDVDATARITSQARSLPGGEKHLAPHMTKNEV